MHIISMLLLPVLFLFPDVLRGVSAVESVPTFEYRDPSTSETLICNKCPPGTHMTAYCTATTPTQCAPCRDQHFTELWNYLPKCLYCYNICTINQEVETECTATSNRVCRCKDGFYMTGDFCMRHSECKPGQGVQTKGTQRTDTVCATCSDGFFSASYSAMEPCVKHQQCANGQIELIPGSITHDAMCGSCEDLANGGETLRTFFSEFFRTHRMRVSKMKAFVARYIPGSEQETLPKQRGPLMDQIGAWLAQAPEEQLIAVPKMLKDSYLCSMTDKLKRIVSEIKQQSPNCTLTLLDG